MNSITLVDIFSGWTINGALFTKTASEVKYALKSIQRIIPFKLIAINTDSGSEFLNVPVFNHFQKEKVVFTKSRPYKKMTIVMLNKKITLMLENYLGIKG
ncbi:MAG: hypothetical protein HQK51_05920 [Oligoflexia bacterium]|nr:hypothetical protein [Oligoflexia bacterium]